MVSSECVICLALKRCKCPWCIGHRAASSIDLALGGVVSTSSEHQKCDLELIGALHIVDGVQIRDRAQFNR